MENFLIVMIFIASIVYKLYTSYKGELEKARKRNPQEKPVIVTPSTEETSAHDTVQRTTTHAPRTPYEHSVSQYPSGNTIDNEIPIVTKSRKKSNPKNPVIEINKQVAATVEPQAFDLRQAVIQAAILERPYQ